MRARDTGSSALACAASASFANLAMSVGFLHGNFLECHSISDAAGFSSSIFRRKPIARSISGAAEP